MNATRRSFLGGLAVASALAGATVAQASVEKPQDAELLALATAFSAAHERFLAAQDGLPSFQAAYRAIAPSGNGVVFDEHFRGPWWQLLDFVRDPTCPRHSNLKTEGGRRVMKICTFAIDRQIDNGNLNPDLVNTIRAKAAQFDRDVEKASELSGLTAALQAYWAAESALRRVVRDVVSQRARSLEGIALKVRATSAYASLGAEERCSASIWLANAVWDDLGEEKA